jgi:hypothetical protein
LEIAANPVFLAENITADLFVTGFQSPVSFYLTSQRMAGRRSDVVLLLLFSVEGM